MRKIKPMRFVELPTLFIVLCVLTLILLLGSCESPSSRLSKQPLVKVVIVGVDNAKLDEGMYKYKYKAKKADHTVCYVYLVNQYEVDDTVMVRSGAFSY